MDITLTVKQEEVYEQVKVATSYTGAKMDGDSVEAYNRIFATDADIDTALSRFWNEAESEATQLLKPFLVSLSHTGSNNAVVYSAILSMPSSFDANLTGSMATSLSAFFADSITASWFRYCNRNDVEKYGQSASAALDDIRAKLYFRKRPTRPTYS